jgi:hypothetical protein
MNASCSYLLAVSDIFTSGSISLGKEAATPLSPQVLVRAEGDDFQRLARSEV